ncbi:Crp/Fnr family transcriptional regulator [Chryseobacterium pennipullorum]|uniref:Cyclic nucleotide-binding domain-containing protein n=1 Tax=Chryseobacterium pennipullorum TaxID=2258963 RepID=A0A3D9B040_9FLAO|nr:hypothetical protein DRF67_12230 [Chryseobacterium pennipullorum]
MKEYNPGEVIFKEGGIPYYYRVVKGKEKLSNFTENGKEFVQNIISEGQNFVDSLLFTDKTYLINAITLESCSVLRVRYACLIYTLSSMLLYAKHYRTVCITSICCCREIYHKIFRTVLLE